MIHSTKKLYRGKKSTRAIKRNRKTRQRKLKGGFKVSNILKIMRGNAETIANKCNEAFDMFKSMLSIAPTIRYIILKYKQRQLKCKNRYWLKKSTSNDSLDEKTKEECEYIQSEIDKLKATHGVASRRAILYSPLGSILTMHHISFWHNEIYALGRSHNAVRRYLFTNCISLTDDKSTVTISSKEIEMLTGEIDSNAEKVDVIVTKEIENPDRNTDDGTLVEAGVNNDGNNVAPSMQPSVQTMVAPLHITDQAQLFYQDEKERFPQCDNLLSAYEHQILLDYRANRYSQNIGVLKGGNSAGCDGPTWLFFLAIWATGLGLLGGGLPTSSPIMLGFGITMISLGGLGLKVCIK